MVVVMVDGLIHITRDGGANWENVTPPDLPEFAKASLIEASRYSPEGKRQSIKPPVH
jgi:hypothetical protein